jgi:hypothetical protein
MEKEQGAIGILNISFTPQKGPILFTGGDVCVGGYEGAFHILQFRKNICNTYSMQISTPSCSIPISAVKNVCIDKGLPCQDQVI